MSEQEAESSDSQNEDEGLAGLQESRLDSVTGGGSPREPLMDLQDAQSDTIKKNEDPSGYETKESGESNGDSGEDD